MKTNKTHFFKYISAGIISCAVTLCIFGDASAAGVASRNTQRASAAAAGRAQQKKTSVVMTTAAPSAQDIATAPDTTATVEPEPELEPEPEIIVENKSSQFSDFMSENLNIATDDTDSELAEKIRQQRAAFNAQSAKDAVATKTKSALAGGKNECDQKLRACMKSKCGDDYSKCAGDTDTTWGDKMDACRRDITCTGEEYRLFSIEIKADRDMNAKLSQYKSIVSCGNKYNDCIITQCGKTFEKCLGKSAGDSAIEKCKKIANECREQDSGMPSRAMEVMGNLRTNAEELIARDEKRLYELRDAMRSTCEQFGAMFDERTLDCVYTINFYGGENGDLMASKKAYAGSSFNCDANWFGIDVTTFMENAFRLTRSQTSASAAALGGGIGIGVGAVTSGAIDRAVDRHKAENALEKELCEQNGTGTWNKVTNTCKCADPDKKFDNEHGCINQEQERQKKLCESTDGIWNNDKNECSCEGNKTFDTGKGCIISEED